MARITLSEVAHSYLKNPKTNQSMPWKRIHNEWDDGGAYALLGPSGCGKNDPIERNFRFADPQSGTGLI